PKCALHRSSYFRPLVHPLVHPLANLTLGGQSWLPSAVGGSTSRRRSGPLGRTRPIETSALARNMATTYLVTGGLGFIGRYLCRELLASGHRVRVLDSVVPQVHGTRPP